MPAYQPTFSFYNLSLYFPRLKKKTRNIEILSMWKKWRDMRVTLHRIRKYRAMIKTGKKARELGYSKMLPLHAANLSFIPGTV